MCGGRPRKTKEHRRNDARGVFRRAIVTRCSDVHRATGAVRASLSRRCRIAGYSSTDLRETEKKRERKTLGDRAVKAAGGLRCFADPPLLAILALINEKGGGFLNTCGRKTSFDSFSRSLFFSFRGTRIHSGETEFIKAAAG